MNKNLIKKILIISGLLIILGVYITFVLDTFSFIDALIEMIVTIGIDIDEIESILTILGLILLIIGIFIKNDTEKEISDCGNKKGKKVKYMILLILGLLPFVGILGFAIFSAINGFSFLFSTSYGFDAFGGVILIYSIFLWPLYIVGLVLIIKSIQKLKQFKNREDK